jgi:hypothetical protein
LTLDNAIPVEAEEEDNWMKHSDNKYKFSSRKTKQTYCFEQCGSIVFY